MEWGITIYGNVINNLRYVYNKLIIAESKAELQQLLDIVVGESEKKGLYRTSSLSVTMVFLKSSNTMPCIIKLHGQSL